MAIGDAAGASLSFTGVTYKLTAISWNDVNNEPIDTTHLATTTDKTYIPAAIADGGTLEVSGQFDPTLKFTIGSTGTATVTWDTSKTWAADAILTNASAGAPGPGQLLDFSATFKISGDITMTT